MSLLAHFNGVSGSKPSTIESGPAISYPGSVTALSDTAPKFGSAAMQFSRSAGEGAIIAAQLSEFNFTGDFTIDMWVKLAPADENADYSMFIDLAADVRITFARRSHDATQTLDFFSGHAGLDGGWIVGPAFAYDTDWHHVMVSRSGLNLYVGLNGTVTQVKTYGSPTTLGSAISQAHLGKISDGDSAFAGQMDELRVLNDTCAWTANFTPPTEEYPTPLPPLPPLLAHFNGTVDTQPATIDSGEAITYQNTNSTINASGKFRNAMNFPGGSGDGLSIQTSGQKCVLGDDFTIDMWVKRLASSDCFLAEFRAGAGGVKRVAIGVQGGELKVYMNQVYSQWMSAGLTFAYDNNWHHVALIRKGLILYGALDGVVGIYRTCASSIVVTSPDTNIFLGRVSDVDSNHLTGLIDEFHVNNGTALWWANFTPPTAEWDTPPTPPAPTTTQQIKGSQIRPTAITKDLLNSNVAGSGIQLGADGSIQVNVRAIALRSAGFIVQNGALTVDTVTEASNETPNGTLMDFTINLTPVTGQESVYLNGLFQESGQDYTISGKTITFAAAPLTGSKIVVKYPVADRRPTLQFSQTNGGGIGFLDAAGNAYWRNILSGNNSSPISVIGGHKFSKLWMSGGWMGYWGRLYDEYIVYALDRTGMVWSWGYGPTGGYRPECPGFGNNAYIANSHSTPVAIARSSVYSQIGYACAIDAYTGQVYTWGGYLTQPIDPNTECFTGDNTVISRSSPVAIARTSSYTQVIRQTILGGYALDADGSLWGWGLNDNGTNHGIIVGDNTLTPRSSPVSIPIPGTVKSLTLSGTVGLNLWRQTAFAIDGNGMIWAWGCGAEGVLGNNDLADQSSPVSISRSSSYTQVVSTRYMSAAIDGVDGSVWVWGNGKYGLGNGTTNKYSSPVSVLGGRSYTKIVTALPWLAGTTGPLFLAIDGATGMIYGWGANGYGQLGDGTTNGRSRPTAIARSGSYKDVMHDGYHTYAIDAALGQMFAWGSNAGDIWPGALMDGSVTNKSSPVSVLMSVY